MTLHIADGAFIPAVVGQFVVKLEEVPRFVSQVQHLEPVIRDPHGHAEIETCAAFFNGGGESGHAADIFCDGDGIGAHLMDDHIGKSQVCQSILIHVA